MTLNDEQFNTLARLYHRAVKVSNEADRLDLTAKRYVPLRRALHDLSDSLIDVMNVLTVTQQKERQ